MQTEKAKCNNLNHIKDKRHGLNCDICVSTPIIPQWPCVKKGYTVVHLDPNLTGLHFLDDDLKHLRALCFSTVPKLVQIIPNRIYAKIIQ